MNLEDFNKKLGLLVKIVLKLIVIAVIIVWLIYLIITIYQTLNL